MKFDYYYLGLEAKLRKSNKFNHQAEAVRVAQLAVSRVDCPIRIFGMTPYKQSVIIGYVDMDGSFIAEDLKV